MRTLRLARELDLAVLDLFFSGVDVLGEVSPEQSFVLQDFMQEEVASSGLFYLL